MDKHPKDWKRRLARLESLDWSRSNSDLWEGRAMTAGRLSKRIINVSLTANAVKRHMGIGLNLDEQELENQFQRNRHAEAAKI